MSPPKAAFASFALIAALVIGHEVTRPPTELLWTPPELSADGSEIDDLSHYRVYWRRPGSALEESEDTYEPAFRLPDLENGEWEFRVTAIDKSGNESAHIQTLVLQRESVWASWRKTGNPEISG